MADNEKNPYLDARREWNERYGSYIQAASAWRIVAVIAGSITIIAVIGLVAMGLQNKHIPYIVEVDKLGAAVAVAPAKQIEKQDTRVIKHALAEFITNYRTIVGDPAVQKDTIFKTYRFIMPGSAAYTQISDSYKQNSPFDRMATERVDVEIMSVIAISATTWQIDWVENKMDAQGHAIGSENYRGAATLKFIAPKSDAEIFNNPTGLWVSEFSWQKILK